jgi:hypothetical protein
MEAVTHFTERPARDLQESDRVKPEPACNSFHDIGGNRPPSASDLLAEFESFEARKALG